MFNCKRTWRCIVILFAISLALFTSIGACDRWLGVTPTEREGSCLLDLQYKADNVKEARSDMAPGATRTHAAVTATLDLLFPITYGAFFLLATAAGFGSFRPWMAVAPAVAVASDLVGNGFQLWLLADAGRVDSLAGVIASLNVAKMAAFGASIAQVAAAIGCGIRRAKLTSI